MCKNADKPCPGCKKHKATDVRWAFFTDAERRSAVGASEADLVSDRSGRLHPAQGETDTSIVTRYTH